MASDPTDLARRSVAVDAAFCRFNARRSTDPRPCALEELCLDGVVAFRDTSRADVLYYNRVLPASFADLDGVPRFAAWYAEVDQRWAVEVPGALIGPAGGSRLRSLELTECPGMAFHHVALSAAYGDLPADPRIRRATGDDVETVLDLIEAGFRDTPAPAHVRDAYREQQIDPAFPVSLLEEDGQTVAMASSFVHAGIAWLGNAYTRPEHRGRGHQLELIGQRLREATLLGCTDALCDVTRDTTSQRNVLRAGMQFAFATSRWLVGVTPDET